MKEPGLFRDYLAEAEAEGPKGVDGDIEKDVGRTMPLNVFFGGDGAGVDKLRRVLTAYSRYVETQHFYEMELILPQPQSLRRLLSRHEPSSFHSPPRPC